jgi:hypothetical protein
VAAWLYDARVSALPYDTSGGMYAAGESLAALGVFLPAALVPTLLALWFLRGHHGFWRLVAGASLAFAIVGLIAVLAPLAHRGPFVSGWLVLLELLGLAQLLGVPLWLGAFALFAFLAPSRDSRRLLQAAVAVELVIAVCAAVHWLVPASPL